MDDFEHQKGQVAQRISALRTRIGLTQEELAAKVGVSKTAIDNWEGGQLPMYQHLARLGAALQTSPAWLLEPVIGRVQGDVLDVERIAAAVAAIDDELGSIREALLPRPIGVDVQDHRTDV